MTSLPDIHHTVQYSMRENTSQARTGNSDRRKTEVAEMTQLDRWMVSFMALWACRQWLYHCDTSGLKGVLQRSWSWLGIGQVHSSSLSWLTAYLSSSSTFAMRSSFTTFSAFLKVHHSHKRYPSVLVPRFHQLSLQMLYILNTATPINVF